MIIEKIKEKDNLSQSANILENNMISKRCFYDNQSHARAYMHPF